MIEFHTTIRYTLANVANFGNSSCKNESFHVC